VYDRKRNAQAQMFAFGDPRQQGPIMPPAPAPMTPYGMPGYGGGAPIEGYGPQEMGAPEMPGGVTVPVPDPPVLSGEPSAATGAGRMNGPINQILAAFYRGAKRREGTGAGQGGPSFQPNMPMMFFE
jgi:hypothetical protein